MTLSPNGASSLRAAFFAAFFCCPSPSLIPYFLKMASASVGALLLLALLPLLLLLLGRSPVEVAPLIFSSDAVATPLLGVCAAFSFTFPNPFASRSDFLAWSGSRRALPTLKRWETRLLLGSATEGERRTNARTPSRRANATKNKAQGRIEHRIGVGRDTVI
jgi:hypothetical protein